MREEALRIRSVATIFPLDIRQTSRIIYLLWYWDPLKIFHFLSTQIEWIGKIYNIIFSCWTLLKIWKSFCFNSEQIFNLSRKKYTQKFEKTFKLITYIFNLWENLSFLIPNLKLIIHLQYNYGQNCASIWKVVLYPNNFSNNLIEKIRKNFFFNTNWICHLSGNFLQ